MAAVRPDGWLERLLRPRSIAVFGGRDAAKVIEQCDKLGYAGAVWPVNPNKPEVAGKPAFKSLDELPDVPDAAFLAVNRHATVEILRDLAARGVGGAVAYASGFSEVGEEGVKLQKELVEAAGAMPVIGPNTWGFINYLDGAPLWPDQHGGIRTERGVAILTQSGNMAINFTMSRRGLPLAYILSLGNQAQLGISDCIQALLNDERVTAIGLHIEGVNDMAAFDHAARAANEHGKPIVCLKVGRSEAASKLALSHTASISGSDRLFDAFCERVGIARARTLSGFLETLKLLHIHGPLPGKQMCSLSCSGGEASLIADAAADAGVEFPDLDEAHRAAVQATVHDLVTVSNPFDYHTFDWARPDRLLETFAAMMAGPYDLSCLVMDIPREDRCVSNEWDKTLDAWISAKDRAGARAAVISGVPESLPEATIRRLNDAGVAALWGIEDTLAAVAGAARIGRAAVGPAPRPLLVKRNGFAVEPVVLDEWSSKRAIAEWGVTTPEGRLTETADEAARAAEELGFPVAVKVAGDMFLHKTELDGVRLNVKDAGEVRAVIADISHLSSKFLVERMVTDAVAELIVGVDVDPQFGPYLVVGSGGVLVELVADSAVLLLPTGRETVARAIGGLKVAKLIAGFRGKPPGDMEAAVDAVLAVAKFVEAHADRVRELDINPLMVRPQGQGVVAADALLRWVEEKENADVA